jgi:hypothetical protein
MILSALVSHQFGRTRFPLSGNRRLASSVFGIAGVVSGILTLHPPIPREFLSVSGIYVGAIFGVVLSICLWVFHSPRSVGRSLAIVMSSTIAYIAAEFSTIWADQWVPALFNDARTGDPPSYVMFVGGVVGAFIISATVLLLYRDEGTKLGKGILICTLGGGALGVLGYSLGLLFSSQDPSQRGDMPWTIPLFAIWQAGMGCLLETVLPEPLRGASTEGFREVSILRSPKPAPLERPAWKVPLWGKLFIGFLAVSLVWFVARTTWVQYEFSQQTDKLAQFRMSRPSLQDLPRIEPIAGEDAVLLHPIAGRTVQLIGPLSNQATDSKPAFVTFEGCYMHLPNERCHANPAEVDVTISQWPNSSWSSYEMEALHYGMGVGYFDHAKTIRMFSNAIMVDANPKEPGKGKFYWTSGPVLIEINSNISDPDEFIREYLERYPSSL